MENTPIEIQPKKQMESALEKMYLINGSFSAADSRKILLEMLHNKINFHNKQIQIIQEQTGGDTSYSENRIDELFDTIEKIKKILMEAESNNQMIHIECPLLLQAK